MDWRRSRAPAVREGGQPTWQTEQSAGFPAKMNTAFELWRQQAAKQRQTEQATVTANRLRDTETNAYQAMSLAQARR